MLQSLVNSSSECCQKQKFMWKELLIADGFFDMIIIESTGKSSGSAVNELLAGDEYSSTFKNPAPKSPASEDSHKYSCSLDPGSIVCTSLCSSKLGLATSLFVFSFSLIKWKCLGTQTVSHSDKLHR